MCAFTKFDATKKLRFTIETVTSKHAEFELCESLLARGDFKIVMEDGSSYSSSIYSADDLSLETSYNEFNIESSSLQFDVYLQ